MSDGQKNRRVVVLRTGSLTFGRTVEQAGWSATVWTDRSTDEKVCWRVSRQVDMAGGQVGGQHGRWAGKSMQVGDRITTESGLFPLRG